jgi:hypothetical protein
MWLNIYVAPCRKLDFQWKPHVTPQNFSKLTENDWRRLNTIAHYFVQVGVNKYIYMAPRWKSEHKIQNLTFTHKILAKLTEICWRSIIEYDCLVYFVQIITTYIFYTLYILQLDIYKQAHVINSKLDIKVGLPL